MKREIDIRLADGAQEIGLAVMLKDLIVQNLEEHPHKRSDFSRLDISIGLEVSDAEIELTLVFSKGALIIHDGIKADADLHIFADSGTIMNLSNQRIKWGLPHYFDETGKEILQAMKSGRLKVKGMLLHFASLIRFSRVMSVH